MNDRSSASIRAPDSGYDLASLFRLSHVELVRLAILLVGDRPTAEDVVQDVFARLQDRKDRLPSGPEEARAYAHVAVVNGCRSVLRRRSAGRRLGGALGAATAAGMPASDSTHDSAEREVILAEERGQVLAALAGLPRRRREVLVLRYYLGLSEAEIAATLGISPGTVKSSAARGLAALARKIGEKE